MLRTLPVVARRHCESCAFSLALRSFLVDSYSCRGNMRCKARQELCRTDRLYLMTLRLISTTGSYNVTLSRTSVQASPLESALPRNASAKRLESALAKSLDLKSPEMNSCRKCGGFPLLAFCNLRLRIGVHRCVHLWLHLLAFLPAPLLPLLCLQAMATD